MELPKYLIKPYEISPIRNLTYWFGRTTKTACRFSGHLKPKFVV